MSEPGVSSSEAQLSEAASVVVYDSNVIKSSRLMELLAERTNKNWKATLVYDQPVSGR